ncbi:hypothetical protein C1645_811231 [Glomus cerebriforme]|uniref:HMG box domain-containing protein n=1 Tax=Glomus cerebriforme TaxID=658196 RepID=A0A397TQE2_9GLOM|nr:hypothetical protein C1645_811231 [Glomus cerebriforme]
MLPTQYKFNESDDKSNTNNNLGTTFIFQNSFKNSSNSTTYTSNTHSSQEDLDSLITRITTNPPYELTLTVEELLAPSKKKRKVKSQSPPPRPQNVFILFKKDLTARLKRDNPEYAKRLLLCENSRLAKATWENSSSEVKQFFQVLYLACVEKHKQLYPGYKYSPKNLKSPKKRKEDLTKKLQDSRKTVFSMSSSNQVRSNENLMKEQLVYFPEFNNFYNDANIKEAVLNQYFNIEESSMNIKIEESTINEYLNIDKNENLNIKTSEYFNIEDSVISEMNESDLNYINDVNYMNKFFDFQLWDYHHNN